MTTPTSGEIRISGRLSALIEVGSGFHPELTGRENIYLSGSILGMRRREIADKLERIIDFAGVRDFIDSPVKHYSSGMYVRLGFSIAAHLEPDILLLDEVLAVGDATFQAKCLDRINQLHGEGRTIVFVSHDLVSVERLCGRVLLLNHGQVIASGAARDVIEIYWETGRTRGASETLEQSAECSREVEITSVTCHDASGQDTNAFRTGSPVTVRVKYAAHATVADAIVELYVHSIVAGQYGAWFLLTTASGDDGEPLPLQEGDGEIEFDIDELGLLPGICHLSAGSRTGSAVKQGNRLASPVPDAARGSGSRFEALSICHTDGGSFARRTAWKASAWTTGCLEPGDANRIYNEPSGSVGGSEYVVSVLAHARPGVITSKSFIIIACSPWTSSWTLSGLDSTTSAYAV